MQSTEVKVNVEGREVKITGAEEHMDETAEWRQDDANYRATGGPEWPWPV